MTFPVLGKENMEAFVPHRGRMLLIDDLMEADLDAKAMTSRTLVREGMLYLTEGGLPSYVTFELMAQTISAWDHYLSASATPQIGFILGVDHFKAECETIPLGSSILTTVTQDVSLLERMFSFKGESRVDGKLVASARLLVYAAEGAL